MRAILGISCLFLGPIFSLAIGFVIYTFLDVSYGAAGNTEGTAASAQQYYSSIAVPVSACVIIGGVALSVWLAFLTLPKKEKADS